MTLRARKVIMSMYDKRKAMDMGQKFVNDLYYGRIAPWERKLTRNAAELEQEHRLARERANFTGRLSREELGQFERLEYLYYTQQEKEKLRCFEEGLRIGARFMETICGREDW